MYKMTQNKKIKIVNMFFRFRFNIYITLCKNDNSTSIAITNNLCDEIDEQAYRQ